MTDPIGPRDAARTVLERGTLDGMRDELESDFTVSLHETGPAVRIIGSPIEIEAVTRFETVTRFLVRPGSRCGSGRLFSRTREPPV